MKNHLIGKKFQAIAMQMLLLTSLIAACSPGMASPRNSRAIRSGNGTSQERTVYTIKEAGIEFEIPKGWKRDEDKNLVLSIEDGAVSLTFIVEDDYKSIVTGMKSG